MSMGSIRLHASPAPALGVVVFDLERALLAAPVSSELWASAEIALYNRRPQRLALAAARVRAARALRTNGVAQVRQQLAKAPLMRGAREAVALLQRGGVVCGLASLGWDFGLEAVAERLGIEHYLASSWEPSGGVVHIWQEDEDEYPSRLAAQFRLSPTRSTLVRGRVPLLRLAHELLQRWG
ncbi:MAG TPA: haloacid dehalogenase-like hydrolase [Polyangiales bacterium]